MGTIANTMTQFIPNLLRVSERLVLRLTPTNGAKTKRTKRNKPIMIRGKPNDFTEETSSPLLIQHLQ